MGRGKLVLLLRIWIVSGAVGVWTAAAQEFHFDSSISRTVLENYLSRSISFTELLHDDLTKPRNSRGVDPGDNIRLRFQKHVLREFGQSVTNRKFGYEAMLYPDGKFVNHWGGRGSVPDMGQLETRMWFYFLTTTYIDVGIEAIHFGQVGLMDKNDPDHAGWLIC
jgi:hypothetical protein